MLAAVCFSCSHIMLLINSRNKASTQSCRHDLWRGGCQSKSQPGVHLLTCSEAFDTIADIFNRESRGVCAASCERTCVYARVC